MPVNSLGARIYCAYAPILFHSLVPDQPLAAALRSITLSLGQWKGKRKRHCAATINDRVITDLLIGVRAQGPISSFLFISFSWPTYHRQRVCNSVVGQGKENEKVKDREKETWRAPVFAYLLALSGQGPDEVFYQRIQGPGTRNREKKLRTYSMSFTLIGVCDQESYNLWAYASYGLI